MNGMNEVKMREVVEGGCIGSDGNPPEKEGGVQRGLLEGVVVWVGMDGGSRRRGQ